MHIRETREVDFIVKCVTHPEVWDKLCDDGAPELYFPPMGEGIMWVRVEDYGVFLLAKQNHITHEVHTILLPKARRIAGLIGKKALKWAFENTDAKRIVTSVPEFNTGALKLAERVGFKQYGVNPDSFQKNGVIYSQTLLGVSKGDLSCQQS